MTVIDQAELRFQQFVTREITGLREEMKTGDASLREEMKAGQQSLLEEIRNVDAALHERIAQVENSLREEIRRASLANIRWMFLFWVSQLAAMIGILYVFFD
jgi:hypothetical protein